LKKGFAANSEIMEEEITRIYVRQIDFTQDISGFFLILGNLFGIIKELGKLIGMGYS